MPFTDFFEHAIDAKLRLAIPARHRAERDRLVAGGGSGEGSGGSGGAAKVWVAVPWRDHLRLFPEAVFARLAEQQRGTLFAGQNRSALHSAFFGLSASIEEDSAGRLLLPRRLIDATKLPSEVVVVGVFDHLEVRSRSAWESQLEAMQQQMLAQIDALDAFGPGMDARGSGSHG
jgi:division/cell wall cluster transcriptional repressor MraZ